VESGVGSGVWLDIAPGSRGGEEFRAQKNQKQNIAPLRNECLSLTSGGVNRREGGNSANCNC